MCLIWHTESVSQTELMLQTEAAAVAWNHHDKVTQGGKGYLEKAATSFNNRKGGGGGGQRGKQRFTPPLLLGAITYLAFQKANVPCELSIYLFRECLANIGANLLPF